MVFFDLRVATPSATGENCYEDELAYATPFVQEVLNDFIDSTTITNLQSDWGNAFLKAFNYLDIDNDVIGSETRRKKS